MSNKTQLQTNNTALDGYIARINAAKEVAAGLPEAGSSGGGSIETCTVNIIQAWGGNDDPLLLSLIVPYYSISDDGNITHTCQTLTSNDDLEAQHTVTTKAYKNIPINIIAHTGYGQSVIDHVTSSSQGGNIITNNIIPPYGPYGFYSLIPTSDIATFTFSSP